MTLSFEHLEQVYERLAKAIDTAGPASESLFLTKLALLLAHRYADPVGFQDCLAAALADLPRPTRGQNENSLSHK